MFTHLRRLENDFRRTNGPAKEGVNARCGLVSEFFHEVATSGAIQWLNDLVSSPNQSQIEELGFRASIVAQKEPGTALVRIRGMTCASCVANIGILLYLVCLLPLCASSTSRDSLSYRSLPVKY